MICQQHKPCRGGISAVLSGLLVACSGSEMDRSALTDTASPEQPSVVEQALAVPEIGAATPTVAVSRLTRLEQRAAESYTGQRALARIDTDVAAMTVAVLIDGPLTPDPAPSPRKAAHAGLGTLLALAPYAQQDQRRATWPELQSLDAPLQPCEHGSVSIEQLGATDPQHPPGIQFQYESCQIADVQIDGQVLIERPDNALQRPTRVGYDDVHITTPTSTQRVTGTLTWHSGDDCGIGEHREARLLITDEIRGISLWLDDLDSYSTAAPVLHDCNDLINPNAWQGTVFHSVYGQIAIDTPRDLSHDWDSLPRATDSSVLFGSAVAAAGRVRLHGTDGSQAELGLEDVTREFPLSASPMAVTLRVQTAPSVQETLFYASLGDTHQGALSRLSDADQDQMPDGWERVHGLDPALSEDAGADPDADGVNNLDEYRSLRDPNNDRDGPIDR